MTTFPRSLLLAGSALVLCMATPALAQDATTNTTVKTDAASTDVSAQMGISAVDAGKLIGEDVVDAKGNKIGDIDSVIVSPNGKVSSVVIDVGGWLESDKKVSVPWKSLKSTADGKITANLTKDQALAAAGYNYKDQSLSGKVLAETGELFKTDKTASNETGTANDATASTSVGSPVRNADGSLNASQVIGLKVVNTSDESIGKIGELVMGADGGVKGVVVDVGGFLGIGAHPVLLDWKQIKLVDRDGSTEATVAMTKDNLQQMPAYTASK